MIKCLQRPGKEPATPIPRPQRLPAKGLGVLGLGMALGACGGGGGGSVLGPSFPLPHSGINANQCYQASSNTLVSCTSTGAKSLNSNQDGMRTNIHARSYSGVPKAAGGTYDKTECVKDDITGLIWEGKSASGPRAGGNTYTNYDVAYSATQAQMDASTNSFGYVNYVNSLSLCGFSDWRLPTAEELQTIVDYSLASPGPVIDGTWFPNTSGDYHWSSSPYAGNSGLAWVVDFYDGFVGNGGRNANAAVRLVRASQ